MASGASRDLGLQRIATSTRFLAVGALVAGGVLSAAVAKALPGQVKPPGRARRHQQRQPGAKPLRSPVRRETTAGATAPPLTAPSQAPQPTTAPPVVSSGGS